MKLSDMVATIEQRLTLPETTTSTPTLVLITGLPGTGKSYFARRLAARVPAVIIGTDFIRRTLYARPTYSGRESFYVHLVAYRLIADLLTRGYHVIFDATNLRESTRRKAYDVADQKGAKLVIVRIAAPEDIVRERLARRGVRPSPEDWSEADWAIYEYMRPSEQRIRRPYVEVDTSRALDSTIEHIARLMED